MVRFVSIVEIVRVAMLNVLSAERLFAPIVQGSGNVKMSAWIVMII